MKRFILLILILAIVPITQSWAQEKGRAKAKKEIVTKVDTSKSAVAVYVCPMHPDVRSDKPGKCPKCGMALVPARPARSPRQKLDKGKLVEEGKYHCCIRPVCDACANMGHACDCYDDVKKGGRVCNECYDGWQEGKGAVPGISKDSVKTSEMRRPR